MKKVAMIVIVVACFMCLASCSDSVEEEPFFPDTIQMTQLLNSSFPVCVITESRTIERIWDLYSELTFEQKMEELGKDNVWSISVYFVDSRTGCGERFTIFQGGACWLGEDYETAYKIQDGERVYQDFLNYYQEACESYSEN